MKNEYPQPQNFVPSQEDAERVAKLINSKLVDKKVTSVNGIPVDEHGNVKTEKTIKVDNKQISRKISI